MEYDKEKVEDMTLALLYLVSTTDKYGTRAWKGYDWDTMDRLHEKGYISNPKDKSTSIMMSDEGAERAKALFMKHFGMEK